MNVPPPGPGPGLVLDPVPDASSVPQVFAGNQDPETPVLSLFNSSTVARYIRINPQTWYQNGTRGDICLRAEVLGCTLPGRKPGWMR